MFQYCQYWVSTGSVLSDLSSDLSLHVAILVLPLSGSAGVPVGAGRASLFAAKSTAATLPQHPLDALHAGNWIGTCPGVDCIETQDECGRTARDLSFGRTVAVPTFLSSICAWHVIRLEDMKPTRHIPSLSKLESLIGKPSAANFGWPEPKNSQQPADSSQKGCNCGRLVAQQKYDIQRILREVQFPEDSC